MEFILKINGSESENTGFVGWTPVKCTLTIDDYNGDTSMPVIITPEHINKSGRIDLYLDNHISAIPVEKIEHDFQSENELIFYIAGRYEHASVAEKDTFILVKHPQGEAKLPEKGIMVRVRKNANKLEQKEMTMFLEAFVRLNKQKTKKEYLGDYTNEPKKLLGEIVLMHTYDAIWEIHQRTSFHPWHRIFNMHLERELQAIKPHVTIPYWKFDEKAEHVFTTSFIGETEKSNNPNSIESKKPKFDKLNPMVNYIENTAWGTLNRAYRHRNPASQDTLGGNQDVFTEKNIIDEGPDTFEQWAPYEEGTSHNRAHNVFTGDVADAGKDPIDPLFFMMHSNVDRLWAKWQHKNNRFDSNQKETYPNRGKYQGKRGQEWVEEWKQNASQDDLSFFEAAGFIRQTNKDIGNFSEDTLWPWDLDTDDSRPMRTYSNGLDPEFGAGKVPEIEIEFPKSPTSNYPEGPITVQSTFDFQDRLNNKVSLGFDYDDIPYFDKDREPSIDIAMGESKEKRHFHKDLEKHSLALSELRNEKNDLNLRVSTVASIDEKKEDFLDTILEIIANPNEPANLRAELINEMLASKRANRFFPSRKPRFFDLLRGLIKDSNKNLRFQAIDILASNEDPIVQEFLVEEIKKEKSDFISVPDAIFFLRQSPKPQHAELFLELFNQSNDISVKNAAIAGLGNDQGSEEFLKKIVLDVNEEFSIREASALSLHNLNHELMNDLAAHIITKSETNEGIKLFRSVSPDPDEVDFKAGLLNMLTFTADPEQLKGNKKLKSSLREVVNPDTENKENFRSSTEISDTAPAEGPTIIEKMATELLDRLEDNSSD